MAVDADKKKKEKEKEKEKDKNEEEDEGDSDDDDMPVRSSLLIVAGRWDGMCVFVWCFVFSLSSVLMSCVVSIAARRWRSLERAERREESRTGMRRRPERRCRNLA